MQSNWLDATLHISPEELRVLDWMEAPTLVGEFEYLTEDEFYDIMLISEIEEA